MQARPGGCAYARPVQQQSPHQLSVATVNWMTKVTRRFGPWAWGVATFFCSLVVPNADPVSVMRYGGSRNDMLALGLMALMAGLTAGLARRWVWPLLITAAIGWAAFTMFPVVMASAYFAALHARRRWHAFAYLSISFTAVVVPAILALDPGDGIVVGVIVAGVMLGLPYALGLYVSARRQVVAGLQERAERLEREHSARADQARAEERARIAREMHDVVAHRVALMVLHAGALEVSASDEKLASEAALIRTTGREALTELRQVLGVLRTAEPTGAELRPQPDLSDVDRLLEQTRAAGVPVSFRAEGDAQPLPAMVQRTAYRVIQEALTNVVKHSGRVDTSVTLRYLPQTLEVRVENAAPPGPVERLPGGGFGLIGLRERVALLYGRFEARQRLDGGFMVTAVLPREPQGVPT
jgi:signal transduction histidine kinase